MVGVLLPSQSWKKFTAEGSPLGLRCNLFLNTFCIYYLMAFEYCHFFRSSVRLRVIFEHQAQATESWSFHVPLFFFGVAGIYIEFWRQTFCTLCHLYWLAWIEKNPPTAYCWNRVSVGSAQATISSAFQDSPFGFNSSKSNTPVLKKFIILACCCCSQCKNMFK